MIGIFLSKHDMDVTL